MSEIEIQQKILLALGTLTDAAGNPLCKLWRNNTGAARVAGRYIKFSFKGAPDIMGFLRGGRFFCIEVKTPTGKQTPEQKAFQVICTEFEVLYILARSVDDALDAVLTALREHEVARGNSPDGR